ncbi:MAG: alcohol dehydrogenase [Bacteroidia bacterium]|nr:MAG: alcohol dehydrogenase [Bacteroidia bacterium]
MEKIIKWKFKELKGEFYKTEEDFPELKTGEVLVKVAGCGVCHTDISFWHDGVKTRKELPLTLGHEISGTVIKGDTHWINKNVIIPAVLPCGECELCKNGRSNICQKQLMPGNDFDGGFASHIVVPSRFLCEVPDNALKNYSLSELAVIADAVSTPYQVIHKASIHENDLAIIIGTGGIGIYAVQIARLFGAKVLALDINDEKLLNAEKAGAHRVLNIKGMDGKTIKQKIKEITRQWNVSPYMWKIFEMSGTAAGQETAFNLLTFASTMSVVGFTMDKVTVRLSNLMAMDATLIGTWGCKPELYPEIVRHVADGKINIKDFIEEKPLDSINEVFQNTLQHKYKKRIILKP